MEHEIQETPVEVPITYMNPSTNAPIYYGPSNLGSDGALLAGLANKDFYAPALDGATNAGVSCLRGEVGDTKMVVKDAAANIRADIGSAEANIRHDVGDAECNIRHDVKDSESNIRREVAKSESDIRADIHSAECETMKKLGDVECKVIKENSDQTLYLTNQLSVIREQGIRNEYETKLSREQAIKEISAKVDHEAERTNDKIQALKDLSAEKFCGLSSKIDNDFFALSSQLAKCCCEAELASATQVGLLNVIANALNVGGIAVASHK